MIIADNDYNNKLQLNISISIGLLTLIILVNYLSDLVGSRLKKILNSNIYIRHFVAVTCLFFFCYSINTFRI